MFVRVFIYMLILLLYSIVAFPIWATAISNCELHKFCFNSFCFSRIISPASSAFHVGGISGCENSGGKLDLSREWLSAIVDGNMAGKSRDFVDHTPSVLLVILLALSTNNSGCVLLSLWIFFLGVHIHLILLLLLIFFPCSIVYLLLYFLLNCYCEIFLGW